MVPQQRHHDAIGALAEHTHAVQRRGRHTRGEVGNCRRAELGQELPDIVEKPLTRPSLERTQRSTTRHDSVQHPMQSERLIHVHRNRERN